VLLGTNKLHFRGHDLIVVGVRIGTVTNFAYLLYTYVLTGGLQLPRVTRSVTVMIATDTYKRPQTY